MKGRAVKISLSKFTIRQQILIGFVPVFAVLIFSAFSSYQKLRTFDQNIQILNNITNENLIFLDIEKDTVELQRNVLVYSYVGYQGVLKKIDFIQKELENKFSIIKHIANEDEDIKDRYNRLLGHYHDYKEGFNEAIDDRKQIIKISRENITPIITELFNLINQGHDLAISNDDYRIAYKISEIKQDLAKISANIQLIEKPSASLPISETRNLISESKTKTSELASLTGNTKAAELIRNFETNLQNLEKEFKHAVRLNRTYLQLINVVLAGKAAEMDKLSDELDMLVRARTQALSLNIKNKIRDSQQQYIILSFLAGAIGLISSILIAMNIANSVRAMASTLSELSTGNLDIEIPGQKRNDEVGQMAAAANQFKGMAKDLDSQSKELEEFAYRTSHDLRSPLVSSIGLLKLVQDSIDKNDYDKAHKGIDLVSQSLNKLETLVKDILELTKTKNISEKLENINIREIIDEALTKFSHIDNFQRLDIQKNLDNAPQFKSFKSRVILILENLISNSIKYQDIEKDNSFVKISARADNRNVIIEIEDNGLGIPKDQQEKMFSMFKRFHPKTSFGSGLGMYMMKKSTDILGGDLQFEDTGEGSKFILSIPML